MIIQAKRIRSLQRHVAVPAGTRVVAGVPLDIVGEAKLRAIGFPAQPDVDTAVVPSALLGRVARYNAEGRFVPDRAQPKRIVYRTMWRTWTDWHGNEHSGYVDMGYLQYPRVFHPPPGVEFRVAATTDDERLIITPEVRSDAANDERLLHHVNLLLETFGECHVFTADLQRIIRAPVRRLNWDVLPRGRAPWAQVRQQLQPIIQRTRTSLQPVIHNRLEAINAHDPEFVAIGNGGFAGYVVFGFPNRNLFLLESIYFGNATYGFGVDWQRLSQLTKAEILDNNLHSHRIVHSAGWEAEIHRLF